MATHIIKIIPQYYNDVVLADKRFEVRLFDRKYSFNDYVYLCEWDYRNECYTGNVILVKITYILIDDSFLRANFCCFSFKILRHLSGVLDINTLQIY